jgi:hypothetical protein
VAPSDISSYPDISDSGGRIVFESHANNFVPNDTPALDVFVKFLGEPGFIRLTQDYSGPNPDFDPLFPRISGDGCFVTFSSLAPGLDPSDTDTERDLFVACLCP